MRSTSLAVCVATAVLASAVAAQDPASRSSASGTAATNAQKSSARPSRGPLPDPALLDGSTQAPEKRPEYGMLGEFEIPGDENAKSDKVGGQQQPPGSPGGGGKNDPKSQQQQQQQGGGGSMSGLPQMPSGGAAGGQQSPGGPPPQNAGAGGTSGPSGGKNDPNASANGAIQVAEIKTDEVSGPATQAGMPAEGAVPKPQPVAIGDPSMQIKPAANTPGVIGAATAGNTQQMEKPTGGGAGKGGASGDNGNKGVEKGRVMPAGL